LRSANCSVILGLSARIFSSCSFIRRSRRSCRAGRGGGVEHRTEPLTTTWSRHKEQETNSLERLQARSRHPSTIAAR
jgi:hypothetical protein